MRRIYRGKRVDNGEWVYGDLLYRRIWKTDITIIRVEDSGFDAYEEYEVIPETVGQYIGRIDKNSTKIFEGDIFKFPDEVWESCYTSCGTEYNSWEVENYGVIGFAEYSAKYDFVKYKYNENSVETDLHENGTLDFVEFLAGLEIIGNIHDNSDLIEGT